MRIKNGIIHLDPLIPEQWDSYSFHVRIRDKLMYVKVDPMKVEIENQSDTDLEVSVFGKSYTAESAKTTEIIKTK